MLLFNRITAFILLAFSLGCARETELFIPESPPQLTLICHPVHGQILKARVSVSTPLYAEDTTTLSPVIFLTSADGGSERLTKSGNAWVSSSSLTLYGTYQITVEAGNFDPISASTAIPSPTHLNTNNLLQINDTNVVNIQDNKRVLRIPIQINPSDLAGSDSLLAFRLTYSLIDKTERETEDKAAKFLSDGATLAYLYETADQAVVISKKYWTNYPNMPLFVDMLVPLNNTLQEKITLINIECRTLSSDYYQYYLSIAHQADFFLPFNAPDVVYNNIQQGQGSFSGYASQHYTFFFP